MSGLPPTKKLRSCDPDLRVVLKFTNEEGKEAEKVYQLYSQNVARLSNFFDASLSVEMKEKATKEIVFKDVSPDIFEKALRYQQDSTSIRCMTSEDAIDLVEFYDKYEFIGGLELCDAVLTEYIMMHNIVDPQKMFPHDLDFFVRTLSMAKKHNLPSTIFHGTAFIQKHFEDEPPYGCLNFTSEQLGMLQPFFKEQVFSLPDEILLEDVDNPLFAKYYAKCRSYHFMKKTLYNKLDLKDGKTGRTKVCFSGLKGNGKWNDKYNNYVMEKDGAAGFWTISRGNNAYWECPGSENLELPPRGPWVPIHESSEGQYPLLYYVDST